MRDFLDPEGISAAVEMVNQGAASTAEQRRASVAEDRKRAGVDTIGHDSVQPWSAGPLFPCVIATVERYVEYQPYEVFHAHKAIYGWSEEETRANYEGCRVTWYALRSLASRLQSVSYELIAYGRREEYATHADAEAVARWINADTLHAKLWAKGRRIISRAVLEGYTAHLLDQRARDAGAV